MASKLIQFSKLNRILFAAPKHQPIFVSANSFSSSGNQKAEDDDAMTQGVDPDGETGHPKQDDDKDNIIPTKLDDHYMHPKTPPSSFSSSKLQTPGVNTPIDPHVQQKRRSTSSILSELTCACAGLDVGPVQQNRVMSTRPELKGGVTYAWLDGFHVQQRLVRSTRSELKSELTFVGLDVGPVQQNRVMLTRPELKGELTCARMDGSHVHQRRVRSTRSELKSELTCAGLDGSPWPEEETASREDQEDDDKEYFEDRKASPLSNMEIGETRKPLEKVVQATSGGYFGGEKVITWLPEQLDTAEESLLRAMRMFREAAARGVPELPHSRRLRELRGEDW